MIAQDSISKVIDASLVEEVVGDFVSLKRRGVNLLGNCPFHEEKTPSFTVSPAKGIYKCFGCGKAGNSVSFIMEHEQLGFADSIRYLAKKFNIELEETQDTFKEKELLDLRESYQIVLDYAASFYEDLLHQNEEGQAIDLTYFKERGLKSDTIKTWQLGFSKNEWRALADDAAAKGFKTEYLEATGLIKKNDRNEWYDVFRDRVIFPIHNVQGKVIAFAGRVLKKDEKTAKYLNSPETDFYKKSKVLYGMHKAKTAIRKEDKCYIVEGYLDVISLHQEGIENVVAASGTSFTEDQSKLIKRFTENVTVLFDGDAAGMKAAFRSIDMLLTAGFNVRVVAMPDGEDPDSLCQKLGGDKFNVFLNENEKDFIIYKSELLMAESENDPIKKSNFVRDILQTIALISNSIKRSFYMKECADLMEIDEAVLNSEMVLILNRNDQNQQIIAHKKPIAAQPIENILELKKDGIIEQEKAIVKALLNYGDLDFSKEIKVADFIFQKLEEDEAIFTHEIARQIYEEFKEAYEEGNVLPVQYFTTHANQEIVEFVANLLADNYDLSHGWQKNEVEIDPMEIIYAKESLSVVQIYKFKRASQLVNYATEAIKEAFDAEEESLLLKEFTHAYKLKQEIAKLIGNVIG